MCGIYGGILIVYFSPSTLPRESGFKALILEHRVIMLLFGGPDVLHVILRLSMFLRCLSLSISVGMFI